MSRKRTGSFFDSILGRTPDLAKKLEEMSGKTSTDRRLDEPGLGSGRKGLKPESRPARAAAKSVSTERQEVTPAKSAPAEKGHSSARPGRKPPAAGSRGKREKNQRDRSPAGPCLSGATGSGRRTSEANQGFFAGVREHQQQFEKSLEHNPLDVIIGLDFGTSSTKVIIHVPRFTGNPAYAVPFGPFAHSSLEYLLPTRLYVGDNGSCQLGKGEGDWSAVTGLKNALMVGSGKEVETVQGPKRHVRALTAATAYLALVIRYARSWFLSEKREIFERYRIHWSVNMGLPAAIDDSPHLRTSFDTAFRAAWLLAGRNEPVTLAAAEKSCADFTKGLFPEHEMPFEMMLLPEVIAEVLGYSRSRFRREGLHFLVDVGASTLDVCSFNIMTQDGADKFPIFTADVKELGTTHLHRRRISGAVAGARAHADDTHDTHDPLHPISSNLEDYVAPAGELKSAVEAAQRDFVNDCQTTIQQTIVDVRRYRDPNSPHWSENIPLFFCGGAKQVACYREAVEPLNDWIRSYVHSCQGVSIAELPKPESLEADIAEDAYHRLAVAWGLSQDSLNIGEYVRPSAIEDIARAQPRDIGPAYVGKDQV